MCPPPSHSGERPTLVREGVKGGGKASTLGSRGTQLRPLSQRGLGLEIPDHSVQGFRCLLVKTLVYFRAVLGLEQS